MSIKFAPYFTKKFDIINSADIYALMLMLRKLFNGKSTRKNKCPKELVNTLI